MSRVITSSFGPIPKPQARFNISADNLSSCLTLPNVKHLRNDPKVDGAITSWLSIFSVAPDLKTSVSSIESLPTIKESINVITFRPGLAPLGWPHRLTF